MSVMIVIRAPDAGGDVFNRSAKSNELNQPVIERIHGTPTNHRPSLNINAAEGMANTASAVLSHRCTS